MPRTPKKKIKELTEDKEFQTELKADRQYLLIARVADGIPPCPKDRSKRRTWMRQYASGARRIRGRAERLKKQFPDTRAAEKAEKLLEELMGED